MPLTDSADIGFGLAITFQSGLMAQITNIKRDGPKRKPVPFIHMSLVNGWIKKIPSDVRDAGTVVVSIYFETHRLAAYKTAMTAAKETVTITYPLPAGGASAGTEVATGFATEFSEAVPVEDGMTADVTIELEGEPTATSAT